MNSLTGRSSGKMMGPSVNECWRGQFGVPELATLWCALAAVTLDVALEPSISIGSSGCSC